MNNNLITFVGASAVLVALGIGFAVVRPVLAQVAATSTDSTATPTSSIFTIASSTQTDPSSTPVVANVPASTPPAETAPAEAATTTADNSAAGANTSEQKTPTEPPPPGLTEVHIIGTKYIDYFSDGSTTIAVPGDQKIDGNLDKPDAPVPTHAGMTWVHTIGDNLYDTPSGDLEVGDYAVQPDGSYIQHAPPFVSSTSTPAQLTISVTTGTQTAASSPASTAVSPSAPDVSIPTTPTGTSADASSSLSL
jgi:hypothetical protein